MRNLNATSKKISKVLFMASALFMINSAFAIDTPEIVTNAGNGTHKPIEGISEYPYVQCQVLMQRVQPGNFVATDFKQIRLQDSNSRGALPIEKFGREKFVFPAVNGGDTPDTAEHSVDIIVELERNSRWVRTNGLGRNLRITARASRVYQGQKQALASRVENSDTIKTYSSLMKTSANEIVMPAFLMESPAIYDYFDPESPKSLLGDQDLELAFIDSGIATAIEQAALKRKIPSMTLFGFSVICEARFRPAALPANEQLISNGAKGGACEGLIDKDAKFEDLDGLNILKRLTGSK